jgi:hypothetical protein
VTPKDFNLHCKSMDFSMLSSPKTLIEVSEDPWPTAFSITKS